MTRQEIQLDGSGESQIFRVNDKNGTADIFFRKPQSPNEPGKLYVAYAEDGEPYAGPSLNEYRTFETIEEAQRWLSNILG